MPFPFIFIMFEQLRFLWYSVSTFSTNFVLHLMPVLHFFEFQFEDKYGFFLFISPIQRVYRYAYLRVAFCGTL